MARDPALDDGRPARALADPVASIAEEAREPEQGRQQVALRGVRR